MTIVVRVRDVNTKGFLYTHETEDHKLGYNEVHTIYSDPMTARFIITLAALHNNKLYTLVHPFAIHVDKECDYATVTYYVKES